MRPLVAFVVILAALVTLSCDGGKPAVLETATASDDGLEIGERVPDIVLRTLDGEAATLRELGGSVVVLAYHGVECPISKKLANRLQALSEAYASRGVRFFGINANHGDLADDVREFGAAHHITFPLVKDEGGVITDTLGADRTTDTFLIDREGILRFRGPVDDQYQLVDGQAMGSKAPSADEKHLQAALDAVLEGRDIPHPRLEAPG